MENAIEMPECPICLQIYDEEEAIPRVLSCGHSACSPCIALLASSSLAKPFADAIRCPACNQVVPYPVLQGPSALPKNIDLLRLCSSSLSAKNIVDSRRAEPNRVKFLPIPWNDPFWGRWKGWIIPHDAISRAESIKFATLTRAYTSELSLTFRENQIVRLLAVDGHCSAPSEEDGSVEFEWSYQGRVMESLNKLTEKERDELHLILSAPLRQRHGLCRVLGLWMSVEKNSPLFLVSEEFQFDLSVLQDGDKMGIINSDDVFGFAKPSLDLCEGIVGLHSQGVACGFLTLSCFRFDSYGHLSLDLSEVLVESKRVKMGDAEAMKRSQYFLSPELRKWLLREDVCPDCGVGYGSDVWSLACILVLLLVGYRDHCTLWDDSNELSRDLYDIWLEKLTATLRCSLKGTRFELLMPILESCFNYDPESRPGVHDLWRSVMNLSFRSKYNVPDGPEMQPAENLLCCLAFTELHRIPVKEGIILEEAKTMEVNPSGFSVPSSSEHDVNHFQKEKDNQYFGTSFNGGKLKSVSLKGHQDCITGLAEGGNHSPSLGTFLISLCVSLSVSLHILTFRPLPHFLSRPRFMISYLCAIRK